MTTMTTMTTTTTDSSIASSVADQTTGGVATIHEEQAQEEEEEEDEVGYEQRQRHERFEGQVSIEQQVLEMVKDQSDDEFDIDDGSGETTSDEPTATTNSSWYDNENGRILYEESEDDDEEYEDDDDEDVSTYFFTDTVSLKDEKIDMVDRRNINDATNSPPGPAQGQDGRSISTSGVPGRSSSSSRNTTILRRATTSASVPGAVAVRGMSRSLSPAQRRQERQRRRRQQQRSALFQHNPISATVVPTTPNVEDIQDSTATTTTTRRISTTTVLSAQVVAATSNTQRNAVDQNFDSVDIDEEEQRRQGTIRGGSQHDEYDEDIDNEKDPSSEEFGMPPVALKVMALAMTAFAVLCVAGLAIYFAPIGYGSNGSDGKDETSSSCDDGVYDRGGDNSNGGGGVNEQPQTGVLHSPTLFKPLGADESEIWKIIWTRSLQLPDYEGDDGALYLDGVLGDTDSPQYRAYGWLVDTKIAYPYAFLRSRDAEVEILEYYTMITFYYATGGKDFGPDDNVINGWVDSKDFLNPIVDLCNWSPTPDNGMCIIDDDVADVDLDKKRLVRISLIGNGLKGTLPPELGLLTSLREISLPGNTIGGSISSSLSKLTNLKRLLLNSNLLSSTLPSSLGTLSNLETFGISHNQLEGTIPLSYAEGWQSIYRIHIHQNLFFGQEVIPSEFCSLVDQQKQLSRSFEFTASCNVMNCPCCTLCL